MKKIAAILAAIVLLAGVFCGGEKKPEAAQTNQPAAAAANVPAGYPAEAFAELTKPELDKFVKALPAVADVLKKAGYKPAAGAEPDLVVDLAATVEGMQPVAGVEKAITDAGTTWPEFRVTCYKVLCTNAAMAMGFAEAMMGNMEAEGPDKEKLEQAKAEIAKAKAVFDQVPKANQTLVMEYTDQLKSLDELGAE